MIQPINFLPNDSDNQKLQCIAEGVNGIIHAMNKESAPSASSNTGSKQALREIADLMERVCRNYELLSKRQIVDNISEWRRQLLAA